MDEERQTKTASLGSSLPETGENRVGFEDPEFAEAPDVEVVEFENLLPESQAEVEEEEEAGAEEDEKALVPYDTVRRYLAEIRKYPVLSREEEKELAIRYKEHGDLDAAYRLVTSNLRLVVLIAREYERACRNLMDLIQEGNVGLMEAVKNFDPYRGVRFPSYAVWWIRAYIIRYIMNNWRMVKVGTTQAQRKLFFNLHKEKERLEAQGFRPEPKLLAQRLDVKESEVVEMDQRLSARDLSVDAPLEDGEATSLLDLLPSKTATAEKQIADAEFRAKVHEKILEFGKTLKGKDQVIFESRLLAENPLTLQEIGDRYGISRERVRQIESRVKKRLREYLLRHFEDLPEHVVDIV
ncbi:MAG: RNA polymerase sigma factor [Candidatus Binatia bacterium]|nr:MAG: RNA polymerase sigma factor [Candidatus Binatia bacterium]